MKILNPFLKLFESNKQAPVPEVKVINKLTPELLLQFAPSLGNNVTELVQILNDSSVNTPLRLAHFLAQVAHESVLFSKTTENMNYSAEGLKVTFSKYFPTPDIRAQYARQPEKIGNRAYANRNGNGSELSGEGYLFRGRGYLQLTGKGNYSDYSRNTYGDDRIVKNPKLLAEPVDAMKSSLWYWTNNNLNKWADADDILAVSRAINLGNPLSKGTPNGLDDRKKYLTKAKALLKI